MIELNTISEMKKGDGDSFALIVREMTGPLITMAVRIVNSTEEAEDIVQECFLKVWEKRSSISNEKSFMSWLRKIVINRCYDFLRKEKRKNLNRADIDALNSLRTSMADEADASMNDKEVNDILLYITEGLSPRQRIVFVLSELEGFSNTEISESTGMSDNAVKSNLHYARNSAREAYNKIEKLM